MGIQSGSFTEGSCDSYDELIRSCEEARIRWGHEEAMMGIVSDCLAGLGLPGCLGLCDKLGFSCPQYNILVLELNWPVGI